MQITAVFILLVLSLSACSHSTNDDALFPLAEGRSWTYRVDAVPDDINIATSVESLTMQSRSAELLDGTAAMRRHSDSGVDYWLRSDNTGIYRVASKGPLDPEPKPDNPVRYVLQKPFVLGTKWEATTTTYLLKRRNQTPHEIRNLARYESFPMRYHIDGLDETVETPAGTFKSCLRVHGRSEIKLYVDEKLDYRDVPLTTREWYCPDVGLVKLERSEMSPSKFIVGGTLTLVLSAWN